MGSWSRKQHTSGRWGGARKGKRLGPRRRIVEVLSTPDSIMSRARVRFECGHEGRTWAGRSAPAVGSYGHCKACLETTSGTDTHP